MILREDLVYQELNENLLRFNSKLKGMKEHLKALIEKKLRLDLEIKDLKKTINSKQTEHEKYVRLRLSMEDSEMLHIEDQQLLFEASSVTLTLIREHDEIEKEINRILEEEKNFYLNF